MVNKSYSIDNYNTQNFVLASIIVVHNIMIYCPTLILVD